MKYLISSLLLLLTVICNAQNSSISGQVIDIQTNEPIDYASVAIFKVSDTSLVTGVITNQSGKFKIEDLDQGTYFIRTQFLGYETKQSENFTLITGQNLQMGNISLEPGRQLMNAVEVSGSRINNLNKLEKQTYRADQFESAKGGSAVDVLKNMPSVAVNGQGEITVRGSSGFLVMINGKPVIADAQTALGEELDPSPDLYHSAATKLHLARVLTGRALAALVQ